MMYGCLEAVEGHEIYSNEGKSMRLGFLVYKLKAWRRLSLRTAPALNVSVLT